MINLGLILVTLFRIACVAGAVWLLTNNIEHGWGWLLFLAFIPGITIRPKS